MGSRFALVLFEEVEDAPVADPAAAEPAPERSDARGLEDELRQTREQLEATSASYDHTVAELQAVNEELRSINEEQKAAAEELETGREEIQSINEELTTINQEHQSTIEELKRTNGDLQNLIESTEIGTIFVDRAMRIRRFTPAVAKLFNFVLTDHGRPLIHITHRLHYPDLVADVRGVLESLERIEREVTSESGEAFIVRMNPYRSLDGEVDGAVLTFFDHTARHAIEDELREAKAVAEAASAAKTRFMGTLSHELRTPLGAILGYAHLLELDGTLTAEQNQRVDRIRAGAHHLTGMIEDLLSFARMDVGREPVHWQPAEAQAIVREAYALMEPAVAAKGLTFVLDVPDECIRLKTDVVKVRQILMNLCGNAVKYTHAGEIRLHLYGVKGRLVFEVTDSGIGIAPEHQERIFERFWQVDGGPSRESGGLGVGLAAAREYGRLLGGDVEVESELGRGSTFRFWLPRRRREEDQVAGR
jgi:two-component system CheB/CheR fusion protein